MTVLDDIDLQSLRGQLRDQKLQQRGLAAAGRPDDAQHVAQVRVTFLLH